MNKGILSKAFPNLFRTNVFTTKFNAFQILSKRSQKIFLLGSLIYFLYKDYQNTHNLQIQYISAGPTLLKRKPNSSQDLTIYTSPLNYFEGLSILSSKRTVQENEDSESQEKNTSKNKKDQDDENHEAKDDDSDNKDKKDKKKKDGENSDDEEDSDDDDDNGGGGLLMPVISWLGKLKRSVAPSS